MRELNLWLYHKSYVISVACYMLIFPVDDYYYINTRVVFVQQSLLII
jgi:hypothetical protein